MIYFIPSKQPSHDESSAGGDGSATGSTATGSFILSKQPSRDRSDENTTRGHGRYVLLY